MRYIFVDEAGTSAREPVTVIVGLIADADVHVARAEELANEALGAVPTGLRDNFTFHATDVFGNRSYQDGNWSLTDRLTLLQEIMSIPRKVGMAIVVSVVWRGAIDFSEQYGALGLSPAQCDHIEAFRLCIALADRSIRRHARPEEFATVVAENVPEMHRYLADIPRRLKTSPINMPQELMRETVRDKALGYIAQSGDIRVNRIRNSVHFVEKSEDRVVQVADACAYGVRRYFAQEKFGREFANAIVGDSRRLEIFESPGGVECYWPISR